MRVLGTMRALDGTQGAIRVQDVYDTDVDDLWEACTTPDRLARWVAEVSGDLRVGGEFAARFTTGWEGTGRIDVCEPPRRLVVTNREEETGEETVVEVTVTPDGDRSVLTIEERGLPLDMLPAHGAGWQVHAEDLAAHLAGRERSDISARWRQVVPAYRELEVG